MGDAAKDAYELETGFNGEELYSGSRKFSKCPICDKEFKKPIGLKDHMKHVHNTLQESPNYD